jgi:hypothetical protein
MRACCIQSCAFIGKSLAFVVESLAFFGEVLALRFAFSVELPALCSYGGAFIVEFLAIVGEFLAFRFAFCVEYLLLFSQGGAFCLDLFGFDAHSLERFVDYTNHLSSSCNGGMRFQGGIIVSLVEVV